MTRRLNFGYTINLSGAFLFWQSIWKQNQTTRSITIRGKVLVGVGTGNSDDPFLIPDDPTTGSIFVTWIDYEQKNTDLLFQKFWDGDGPLEKEVEACDV